MKFGILFILLSISATYAMQPSQWIRNIQLEQIDNELLDLVTHRWYQSIYPDKTAWLQNIKYRLNQGANPNAKTPHFEALALSLAVQTGSPEAVRLLLNAGANPNLPSNGLSPLHAAVVDIPYDYELPNDCMEIIKALLNAKADPNIQDRKGNTPLMIAAKKRNLVLVKTFLSANADLDTRNKQGISALELSRKHGEENPCFEYILGIFKQRQS